MWDGDKDSLIPMLTLKIKLPVILPAEMGLFGSSREWQPGTSKALANPQAGLQSEGEQSSFTEERGSWEGLLSVNSPGVPWEPGVQWLLLLGSGAARGAAALPPALAGPVQR